MTKQKQGADEAFDLSRRYRDEGRLAEALECIEVSLAAAPADGRRQAVKVDILRRLGRRHDAAASCHRALTIVPFASHLVRQILTLGEPDGCDAQAALATLDASPHRAVDYARCLAFLNKSGDQSAAVRVADDCAGISLSAESEAVRLALERARTYTNAGRHRDAVRLCVHLIRRQDTPAHRHMLAVALFEIGKPQLALRLTGNGRWQEQTPPYDNQLLPALYATGRIEAAHLSYRDRRTSANVSALFDRAPAAALHLRSTAHSTAHALMVTEGGVGDEIRISAIYDEVASHFASLTCTCDPRLLPMMRRSFPSISFVPVARHRTGDIVPPDRTVERYPSLATCLNDAAVEQGRRADVVFTTLEALGEFRRTRDDFIRHPSRLVALPLALPPSSLPRVGLVWRSILRSPQRNVHYIQPADFEALAGVDAEFWCLQARAEPDELDTLRAVFPDIRLPELDLVDDLEGQASLIANLDAVVSPLTTTAELSGILGTTTLILSRTRSTAWRRNPDGSDVWYPQARLMIGTPTGDTPSMMKAVARQLAPLTSVTTHAP
jgi:hypothetical protein